jgi:AraC-like DNA-binding protein
MAINNQITIKKEYAEGKPGHILEAKYFYFDNQDSINPELSILCGGFEKCAPDFQINRSKFPFFAILFISNGRGTFQINNKQFPISYGSLIAFSPGQKYQFQTDPKSPMEQLFVIFKGSNAKELLDKSGLETKGAIKVNDPEAVLNIFRQIVRNGLNHTDNAHSVCCCYLKAIFLEQADAQIATLSTENIAFENYAKCKTYLENNFAKIHSSKQLAELCGLNIRYIARLFKKYCNTRPYEYLLNLKMNKAANLLLTSNLNIKEISAATGIDDQYHFSRIFKKKFHIPPTEYRKSMGIA